MRSPGNRAAPAHQFVIALLLGLHFVLQLLLILPIALVVFPFAIVAGIGHEPRDRDVRGRSDPPSVPTPRRKM